MSAPDTQACFTINLRDGALEICGSESFVSGKLEEHKELVSSMLDKLNTAGAFASSAQGGAVSHAAGSDDAKPPTTDTDGSGSGDSPSGDFPNVLAISGEEVRIIADIPGSNGREQTLNAALLYLLGKSEMGQARASFKEIREVCKRHGFVDSSNFAQYMKSSKKEILVHGSGQSMEAELTFPGKKAARALAAEVESQA